MPKSWARALEADEHNYPYALWDKFTEAGFHGVGIPEEYGGQGGDVQMQMVLARDLARSLGGLAWIWGITSFAGSKSIGIYGTEDQKQKYLPKMALGEILGCFGLTEPDAGSNPGSMRTRARKDGNDYILNGEKMWITSGSIANIAIIWAKVEDENERVRGFIVETDRPGFRAADVHGKWSLRASVTSSLSLQDVRVPAENLLPSSGGLRSPLSCLNQARYGIGWGAIGAAMACYDCALQYAQFRKQFRDMPIAGHQLVQEKLVWMISEITKAQLLALQVGRLKDAGKAKPYHISMLKRNNVWMALECARMGRDILGGNGIADEYPIFRHMANLESVKTYEGTHDIHTLIIGEHITGIAAF